MAAASLLRERGLDVTLTVVGPRRWPMGDRPPEWVTYLGYVDGAAVIASATAEKVWRWSDEGRLPVVIDASSCALGLVSDVAPSLGERRVEIPEHLVEVPCA